MFALKENLLNVGRSKLSAKLSAHNTEKALTPSLYYVSAQLHMKTRPETISEYFKALVFFASCVLQVRN